MFRIILSSFQVDNKFDKTRFFLETFLIANIKVEVILDMFFLTLSNANVLFLE